MSNMIHAEVRKQNVTRGELRKLREQGKIPAVLKRGDGTSSPIMIEEKDLMALLKNSDQSIFQMALDDQKPVPAMVGEIQREPVNRAILHVDFRQINMQEPIRAEVRVELVGQPKGHSNDYLIQTPRVDVEIRCMPDKLPSVIEADISHLEIGNSLTAGELQLPEGVELLTEPNESVVVVLAVQKGSEAEAEAEEQTAEAEAAGEEA